MAVARSGTSPSMVTMNTTSNASANGKLSRQARNAGTIGEAVLPEVLRRHLEHYYVITVTVH
jgi:hypothetical protein